MNTKRELRWNLIALALVFVVIGVVFLIYPAQVQTTACYVIAIALMILGVMSLINYLRKDVAGILYRYDLVVGLSAILGGILVILKLEQLTGLVLIVLSFLVTISGILKMQNSVDLLRLGHGTWHVAFAMAILNIILGILLLINPFSEAVQKTLIGIALIYSGLTDLYVTITISKKLAELKKELAVKNEEG